MKTLEHSRVQTVEHQRYAIPADQVTQHIKRIVPNRAIVHYWYEIPESTTPKEPEESVQNPQLKGFLTDMKKFGGLLPEDVEAMKKHSKEFRKNFDL